MMEAKNESLVSLYDFWYRYKKNKAAVMGLVVGTALFLIAILAPVIAPFNPIRTLVGPVFLRPLTPGYYLGTDSLGRDVFSEIVYGTRTALIVGIVAAAIGAAVGTVIGMISGFFGGIVDDVLMRITEMFVVIPIFFIALVIVSFIGQNVNNIIMIIGLLSWPVIARLTRAEFLSLREREFVQAARADGAGEVNIMIKEILPNVLPIITVASTLQISSAILIEAGLSFLGLGDSNVADWGIMLQYAQSFIYQAPWLILLPGIAITLATLAFNEIGDGLNDALNPKLKER
ncbi:MAG TPA: ABC transporter permease [Candidatus Bathyarchaeia archaeon]|nr:ABC transporter permease [Candidatus Bathyarchaeia archaeon]